MRQNYDFFIITQYGKEPLLDYATLRQRLKMLQTNKEGFVRLAVDPFIHDRRYLETIYDAKEKNFYTCILEDRCGGQGIWEYRSKNVPIRKFKRLFKRHRFDVFVMLHMNPKPIGIQRSVKSERDYERICMVPFEVENAVYDKEGKYGGDQTHPAQVEENSEEGIKLRQIIQKYYPHYDEKQMNTFLSKLRSEGCGYVVVINTIFEYFLGREEEFERTFGMPMYDAKGELNYDMLLTDFYAATDNHICKGGRDCIDYEEDRGDDERGADYDYTLDTTGEGTNFARRNYRIHLYLKDKGFGFAITNNKHVTLDNVRELSQKGRIVISLNNGNVQNKGGSVYSYCNSHAMVITGVTRDGRYIVSTWGLKKYVDPSEIVEKDGKETKIFYQYYEEKRLSME